MAADAGIDALIVLYIPPLEDAAPDVAQRMVEAIGSIERRIPVLTCFMSARGLPEPLRAPGVKIPSFAYPEQAAIALAHAVELGAWRAKPHGEIAELDGVREDEAAAVLAAALARDGGVADARRGRASSSTATAFRTVAGGARHDGRGGGRDLARDSTAASR